MHLQYMCRNLIYLYDYVVILKCMYIYVYVLIHIYFVVLLIAGKVMLFHMLYQLNIAQPLIANCSLCPACTLPSVLHTVHIVQPLHEEEQTSYMLLKSKYHFSWSVMQHETASSPISHPLACCSTSYTDHPAHSKYF